MRSRRGGLALLIASALGLAACSAGRAVASPHPTPTEQAITASPAGPPPAGSGFDPEHVAAVLGPAVGMVIVNTAQGTDEGSSFTIAHGNGVSYMVTNNHVIAGNRTIQVLLQDGRHFVAQLQGTDPQGDIAVLRVPDASLPLASFADSTKLRVGQQVVAIGSPLGNQGSVTSGIISALHRNITAGGSVGGPSESLPDVLQTDAAINPGNSGGPLADADGHVVGVNTATEKNASNVGFAIPSLLAKRIADDLIAGRKPGHPFLGVAYLDAADALASGKDLPAPGDLVTQVVTGSAASRAGVRVGDVIQKVDGVPLINGETLGGLLQIHHVGDHVKLTVFRSGSSQDLDTVLGDRPAGT
ncbi:MAG: hypothetical protein NVS9B1_09880 [Candidatus Dormibacteraceae bacterium]